MPRANNGSFTLVAGNPVSPNTVIDSNWANTTLADIRQALTDSLSRSGKGGMLSAFEFADGTSAKPSITFATDTNTGLFKGADDDIRMTVGGVVVCRWTASTGIQLAYRKADNSLAFRDYAHDTDEYNAHTALLHANRYLSPVNTADVAFAGSIVVLYGVNGRTVASAESAMVKAENAVPKGDKISLLTNDKNYINADQIPPSSATKLGGIKYEFDKTTKILKISV